MVKVLIKEMQAKFIILNGQKVESWVVLSVVGGQACRKRHGEVGWCSNSEQQSDVGKLMIYIPTKTWKFCS